MSGSSSCSLWNCCRDPQRRPEGAGTAAQAARRPKQGMGPVQKEGFHGPTRASRTTGEGVVVWRCQCRVKRCTQQQVAFCHCCGMAAPCQSRSCKTAIPSLSHPRAPGVPAFLPTSVQPSACVCVCVYLMRKQAQQQSSMAFPNLESFTERKKK